jgi:hypothetical protein
VRLREALGLLLAGRIRGAQVLYEYAGHTWCDTVIRQRAGHRLIRIETPRRAASVAEEADPRRVGRRREDPAERDHR